MTTPMPAPIQALPSIRILSHDRCDTHATIAPLLRILRQSRDAVHHARVARSSNQGNDIEFSHGLWRITHKVDDEMIELDMRLDRRRVSILLYNEAQHGGRHPFDPDDVDYDSSKQTMRSFYDHAILLLEEMADPERLIPEDAWDRIQRRLRAVSAGCQSEHPDLDLHAGMSIIGPTWLRRPECLGLRWNQQHSTWSPICGDLVEGWWSDLPIAMSASIIHPILSKLTTEGSGEEWTLILSGPTLAWNMEDEFDPIERLRLLGDLPSAVEDATGKDAT